MGDQDENDLSMDPKLLSSTILTILRVEERIEKTLNEVLANVSRSLNLLQGEARQTVSDQCNEDSIQVEKVESMTRRSSKPRAAHRSSICSVYSTPGGAEGDETKVQDSITTTLRASVQMRSAYKLWIEEQACEGMEPIAGALCTATTQKFLSDNLASAKSRFSDCIPINPNSVFVAGWSAITIVVLMAQLIYVPYETAWHIELESAPILLAAFWSFDVSVNFLTGSYNADGEKNSLRVSARAYALTSLPLDISLVLLDWLSVFDVFGHTFWNVLRFGRLARMLRLMTILRISQFSRKVHRIMDSFPLANGFRTIVRAASSCVFVLWFLHTVACLWFAIGRVGLTDSGKSWLGLPTSMADGTEMDVSTQDPGFQYMICFHWTVATFTLGNMEIGYANRFERMFGIAFTMIGFLFGSIIISLLSAIFVDYQTACMENTIKLRTVDSFLGQNNVSDALTLRVQKVCLERVKMKEQLTFSDAVALENLPAALYKELRYEIIGRFLKKHDLFQCYSTVQVGVVEECSVDGVERVFLKPGDELFKANDDSDHTFFFSSGELTYSKSDYDSPLNAALVPVGTWLSEAALWANWRHVGTCEAKSRCTIAVVSHERLAHHVRGHRLILAITLSYCHFFCRAIALAKPPFSQLPDDLCVPFTKFAEMLSLFPTQLRLLISTQALEISKLGKKPSAKLEEEVRERKCTVHINSDGELERTVAVTVLMLSDGQSRVLYQVGRLVPVSFLNEEGDHGHHFDFAPELKLPGLKYDPEESIEETLSRLVNKKLEVLTDKFEHVSTRFEEEDAFSKELGVRTTYLRTKIICTMTAPYPGKLVSPEIHIPCASPARHTPQKHPTHTSFRHTSAAGLRRPAALQKLIEAVSLSSVSLCIMFEETKPFLYAWLPHELADTLKGSIYRDEVLSLLIHSVNMDTMVQEQLEEHRVRCSLDRFAM